MLIIYNVCPVAVDKVSPHGLQLIKIKAVGNTSGDFFTDLELHTKVMVDFVSGRPYFRT